LSIGKLKISIRQLIIAARRVVTSFRRGKTNIRHDVMAIRRIKISFRRDATGIRHRKMSVRQTVTSIRRDANSFRQSEILHINDAKANSKRLTNEKTFATNVDYPTSNKSI
jgi:hypothetical protein